MDAVGHHLAKALAEVLHALASRFENERVTIVEIRLEVSVFTPRKVNFSPERVFHPAGEVNDEAKQVGGESLHLTARFNVLGHMTSLSVDETKAVDAQFHIQGHGDAQGSAPLVEVHLGQVKLNIGLDARALIGITKNSPFFVDDLMLPIIGIYPRQ